MMMKHSDASVEFGGPDPDCFDPSGRRMMRLCKSKTDNSAVEAAEASRRQAQLQHEENMRNLRKQARLAGDAKSPEFTPASPPAAASVDTVEAGLAQRRKALRRFGFAATVSGGAGTGGSGGTLGSTQALGG